MTTKSKSRWAVGLLCLLLIAAGGMAWTVSLHRRQHALDAALIDAVARNNCPRLQALLTQGADPDARWQDKKPLPFLEICRQMFGLAPHAAGSGNTALMFAAELGRIDIAKALLAAHANVNLPGKEGWTPLHAAAKSHRPNTGAMLLFLTEHGADMNAKTGDGLTVWYLARNDPRSLQALRQAGRK